MFAFSMGIRRIRLLSVDPTDLDDEDTSVEEDEEDDEEEEPPGPGA